jgi:FlaA1/EpsC-like NDP-sugar epimerase
MTGLRTSLFRVSQQVSRNQKQILIWLSDIVAAPVAFYLSCAFVYSSVWPQIQLERLTILFPSFALMAAVVSLSLGLPRIKLKTYESFVTVGTLPFSAIMGGGAFFLTTLSGLYFPVVGTLSYTLILFLLSIGTRTAMLRVYIWALRAGKPRVRVLIYGAGTTGLQLASALKTHETVMVVAFLDDDPSMQRQKLAGLRIFAPSRVEEVVRNYDVARVILAMPSLSAPKLARIGRQFQTLGLEVQIVPSFAQLVGAERLIDTLTPLVPGMFLGRDHLDQSLPDGSWAYEGCSILVSGAGGSVGSELCRQLVACRPRRLVLFEVSELALYTIERELNALSGASPIDIVPVLGSVTDARAVRQALARNQVEIVLHAAAYKHVSLVELNPIAGLVNNVVGTRTLADVSVEEGVKRLLLVSTDKAVRPTNVMGASKRIAELVLQDIARRAVGTHFSIVRFGNVLGSSGSVIPLFKEQIARGGPVTLTHEDVTRYFMTLTEAARLVLLAGSFSDEASDRRADVFVLDMGKPVSIRQLAEQLIHAAGYTVRDSANPGGDIEIKVIGLRPGEKLHEELLIGEGLLTTPHAKILRASEECPGDFSVPRAMQQLGRLAVEGDAEAARDFALALVKGSDAQPAERETAAARS